MQIFSTNCKSIDKSWYNLTKVKIYDIRVGWVYWKILKNLTIDRFENNFALLK